MRIEKDCWLISRPIAHRGLWGNGIIENSLSAYHNAIIKGYPIEIDVYMSIDGELYSFHDLNLSRMTGKNADITSLSSQEIDKLRLSSDEKIPRLKEVLSVVGGKVPLLIELKNQLNGDVLVKNTLKLLKEYRGEYAIQSFNPLYLKTVKKEMPNALIGILSTCDKKELKKEKFLTRLIVKNMALNFLIKPDFISYYYKGLPLKKRKTKNKKVIAWTITDEKTANAVAPYSDNIIFENFLPK
ncbi:MAG: glycerophosphodiester phosphodiesterase [Clostridia bacterium]|nr:glycerophosphodiester phosphodiesterase [Clostridia bacterium]